MESWSFSYFGKNNTTLSQINIYEGIDKKLWITVLMTVDCLGREVVLTAHCLIIAVRYITLSNTYRASNNPFLSLTCFSNLSIFHKTQWNFNVKTGPEQGLNKGHTLLGI